MKSKKTIFGIIVSLIVIGTTTFGIFMYNDRKDFMNYLDNQYQKNLYDLITSVDGLQVSLSKAMIASSKEQGTLLFGDVWRQAGYAQDKINSLPIRQVAISRTSKFLSQVSDFSYTMLKSNNTGKNLTSSEFDTLEKLKDYSGYLTMQLRAFENEKGTASVNWSMLNNKGNNILKNTSMNINTEFQNISDQMQKYPTLIYDGPFSENVLNIKPKVLSEKEISIDDAKKIAEKVVTGNVIENISEYSNKSGEKIPTYALSLKLKTRKDSNISMDISKNGGHIVYMLDSRNIPNSKLTIKQAVDIGLKFLKNNGYPNMIPTYTLRYDNIAVINYVSVKNKTLIYPDQIKLKIALDNGNIVGMESQHYLIAHYNRKLVKPKVSETQAAKKISKKLNVKNIRLTLIPMESLREVLCYEFYGEYKGERYFVYINSYDGSEERILKIIDTENGELTM